METELSTAQKKNSGTSLSGLKKALWQKEKKLWSIIAVQF